MLYRYHVSEPPSLAPKLVLRFEAMMTWWNQPFVFGFHRAGASDDGAPTI